MRERAFILEFARHRSMAFRADFVDWLTENMHIWERFDEEANRVYATGRKHYGARTIWEVMRHETALRGNADGEWKLNDHRPRDLARLWLLLRPERAGFFETRERRAA